MIQEKLDRINELARLAKERELTDAESTERSALRKEYLAEWRQGLEQTLDNTYLDHGDGNVEKLKKKDD